MRILLHNPAVDFGTLEDFYAPIPSLGLAYSGGVLRQAWFEVRALDSFMSCQTVEEIISSIRAARPDVLGVSLLTPSAPLTDRVLIRLRAELRNLWIIIGNVHASVLTAITQTPSYAISSSTTRAKRRCWNWSKRCATASQRRTSPGFRIWPMTAK